ncbi:MAG TPA: hypothetical protein VFE47_01830 [Tepidisphaeraceae bacterium]|jgi:hypothetical protein|nr:hypothetical protein [Tepidisphaeraceae bacterium]
MTVDSAQRVEKQTPCEVNAAIRRATEMRVAYYAEHTGEIDDRLRALDQEWDVERLLQTMSASVTLVGLTMAIARNRKWIFLPILVQGFFLQHAIQGWCPPLAVVRRLGFRTIVEIETERYALKAIRGDFQNLPDSSESRGTAPVLEAVRK